jgi:hypothetical protein
VAMESTDARKTSVVALVRTDARRLQVSWRKGLSLVFGVQLTDDSPAPGGYTAFGSPLRPVLCIKAALQDPSVVGSSFICVADHFRESHRHDLHRRCRFPVQPTRA